MMEFMIAIAFIAIVIIFFISIGFNDSGATKAQKVFAVIVLTILLVGFFISGMAGVGELMPTVLAPFILFFIISIYMAKEDRATERLLLKQVNEKLEKTEKELEEIKLLLSQKSETEEVSEKYEESEENKEQ